MQPRKTIRFGQYSFTLLAFAIVLTPLAVAGPFSLFAGEPEPTLRVFAVGSFLLVPYLYRLWYRLCLRIDWPYLDVGRSDGRVRFDLRDPDVCIEIKQGILVVSDGGGGRRVRAWGVDGAMTGKNGFSYRRTEHLAIRLQGLLGGKGGASLVYVRQQSQTARLWAWFVRRLRRN